MAPSSRGSESNSNSAGFQSRELAIVLSHYRLGTIHEIRPLSRGDIHVPKLVIRSERGKFLLKKRPLGRDDPYRVALAHDLQLFLIKKQFPLPKLVGTRQSNSSMWQNETAIYELFIFVDGQSYDGSEPSTIDAGVWLRRFHDLVSFYEPAYEVPIYNYHDNKSIRKNIQQITETTRSEDGQSDPYRHTGSSLLAAYNQAAQSAQENGYAQEKSVLCHGDWHPGNMIFQSGRVAAVLDFESVRFMPALGDVAMGCLQFSLLASGKNPDQWPAQINVDRARWFLRGYDSGDFWTDQKRTLLIALMIEALIAEAITPVAATGMFADLHGLPFLRMIDRKIQWLMDHGPDKLRI